MIMYFRQESWRRRAFFIATASLVFVAGMLKTPPAWAEKSDAHGSNVLPLQLRPALYRVLAHDTGANLDIHNSCAHLPEQTLTACFDAAGAHFHGASAPALALHLVAWGRGHQLTAIPAVRPAIADNHVNYVHRNITEWWRVLPIGFEQGFTLNKRRTGHGELILEIAESKNAVAGSRGESLDWHNLRYGQLVVTDNNGRQIPAALKTKDNKIFIQVSDTHARYPLTVDPLVWEMKKVVASDGAAGNGFGGAVAINGTVAIIGAPSDTIGGNLFQGAAYVFTESPDGTWQQVQKLTASDGAAYDGFGSSIAINGKIALIGADDSEGIDQGAVYVYSETSNGAWSPTQELTASDGYKYSHFGSSVSLDGTTALIGANGFNLDQPGYGGAAYVFTQSTQGHWTQVAKLTANDNMGNANDFGVSVALSGTTALIGADTATVNGNLDQGAAYVFTNTSGNWTQSSKLSANNGTANDYFGDSVAIEGNTVIVGENDQDSGPTQGAAYVFTGSGSNWTQTTTLTASDGTAGNGFGDSVAMAGANAVIGSSEADINGNAGQGAAYVFTESGNSWNQTGEFTASNSAFHSFYGAAVALDDNTILVGADNATVNGNTQQGDAFFYDKLANNLNLTLNDPAQIDHGSTFVSQTILSNNGSSTSLPVSATINVAAYEQFVSVTTSQGSCKKNSRVLTCDFGSISGNGGTATADLKFKASGGAGNTIRNTASIAMALPPLTASAATKINSGSGGGGSSGNSSSGGGGFDWLELVALLALAIKALLSSDRMR